MEDIAVKQAKFKALTEQWSDHYGLITPNPDKQVSGNGIRYTSEWIYALLSEGVISYSDAHKMATDMFVKCMNTLDPKDKKTDPVYGNIKRHPDHFEQEGPDDYIALISILYATGSNMATSMILRHGQLTGFWYNTERPFKKTKYSGKINWSAWMGRFPQLICHMYFSCYIVPNIFLRISWGLSILYTALFGKRHADTWVLSWHLVKTISRIGNVYPQYPYPVLTLIAKFWQKRMRKIWGEEGVRLALREYFGNGHPLGEYFPKGDII